MATTTPFTYNPGSPIAGQNQSGSIAYGDTNLVNDGDDYSGNPGGKKWWMGADEENKYIICKDVSTSDWPTQTPEGDIGSVRFWGSAKTDAAFVLRVNTLPARAGLIPLDDVFECKDWLDTNGYWTNFSIPNPPPGDRQRFAIIDFYRNPSSLGSGYGVDNIAYSSENDTMYAFNTNTWNYSGFGNATLDNLSSLISGSRTFVSLSADYLSVGSGYGAGSCTFDNNGAEVYIYAGTGISRYTLSTNALNDSIAVTNGNRGEDVRTSAFDDVTSKYFVANGQYLNTYETSPRLSLSSSINLAPTQNLATVIVADTINDSLCMAGTNKFTFIDPSNSSFIGTGSVDVDIVMNGVYSSTSENYYFGVGRGGSPAVMVIDANLGTVSYVNLPVSGSRGAVNTKTTIAYDPARDFVWGMSASRNLIGVDCSTNTVSINSNVIFEGTNTAVMPQIANGKIAIGSRVNNNSVKLYDLELISPS